MSDIELIVRNKRSSITKRLSSELNEKEKKTQARLEKLDSNLFTERLRILKEYLEVVSVHLQIADILYEDHPVPLGGDGSYH